MIMNIFYTQNISLEGGELTGQELTHCTRVLRHKAGDVIHVMDGVGHHYAARLDSISKSRASLTDVELLQSGESNDHLPSLAFGLLKTNDRMEWLAEKAVEIGVKEIYPLYCHHCERRKINIERMVKIILSAAKQSRQLFLPRIHELMTFSKFIDGVDSPNKLIAHYRPDNQELAQLPKAGGSTLMLIGPEGDFSTDEVSQALDRGFDCVNLGPSRLRAETAGMVALTLINNK